MQIERKARRLVNPREGKPDTDIISLRKKALSVQRFLKKDDAEVKELEKGIVDAEALIETKKKELEEAQKAVVVAEDKLTDHLEQFIDISFRKK